MIEGIEEFSELRLPTEPIPITYNAAPQSLQPIIRFSRTGAPEIAMARWGLIPYWSTDARMVYSTINARSEELAAKPAFRESLKNRRCLIPANCFYEWQRRGSKDRQPFAIAMRNGQLFMFAGLWDRWRAPDGNVIESFTIVTVAPNELVKPLHDRMPCIVAPEDYVRWLDSGDPAGPPVDLLQPFPSGKMQSWPIGKAVGNVRNDDAGLIKELARDAAIENQAMRSLWD